LDAIKVGYYRPISLIQCIAKILKNCWPIDLLLTLTSWSPNAEVHSSNIDAYRTTSSTFKTPSGDFRK